MTWEKPNERIDGLSGLIPESWLCVDCGFNTAPGLKNRAEMEAAIAAMGILWKAGGSVQNHVDTDSEVYTVRDSVWKKAGMAEMGGCLCIGCLERRIGRRLKPKDFPRDDPFNSLPGTARLMKRRG